MGPSECGVGRGAARIRRQRPASQVFRHAQTAATQFGAAWPCTDRQGSASIQQLVLRNKCEDEPMKVFPLPARILVCRGQLSRHDAIWMALRNSERAYADTVARLGRCCATSSAAADSPNNTTGAGSGTAAYPPGVASSRRAKPVSILFDIENRIGRVCDQQVVHKLDHDQSGAIVAVELYVIRRVVRDR